MKVALGLCLLFALLLVHIVEITEAKPRYSSAGTGAAGAATKTSEATYTTTTTTAADASAGLSSIKAGEKDLLDDMLRESDVLNLLEQEQKKHERRLKELQNKLERELQQVQEHFESVMTKLKKTEEQLEVNLKNVEKSLIQQVKSSNERTESASGGWRWPFFILLILLAGLGGFFGRLYKNATKGMRML
jgi:hypothetical protein